MAEYDISMMQTGWAVKNGETKASVVGLEMGPEQARYLLTFKGD